MIAIIELLDAIFGLFTNTRDLIKMFKNKEDKT